MARKDRDTGELEEQLADAQAQLEGLQSAAADAEARASTARAELVALREAQSTTAQQLADAEAARDSAQAELSQTRAELTEARSQIKEAAARYRDARLAAEPAIPPDLVPALESVDEIDQRIESARGVVGQVREKIQEESEEANRAARVPIGSPPRRAPDLSGLSPSEKIKLGLQQMSEREAR